MRYLLALLILTISTVSLADPNSPCWDSKTGPIKNCKFEKDGYLKAGTNGKAYFQVPPDRSISFDPLLLDVDGTQCTGPFEESVNGGPREFTIRCQDHASSVVYGNASLPTDFSGQPITFELDAVSFNSIPTGNYRMDISCMCKNAEDTIDGNYSTPDSVDDLVLIQFAVNDQYRLKTAYSGPVSCSGTCGPRSFIFWKSAIMAPDTTGPANDVRILGIKLRYPTTNSGDNL